MTKSSSDDFFKPYITGLGVGKWDCIMTYGHKIQYDQNGDPTPFDFTPQTFSQIVDNFSRTYSKRRLGMDYKHVAGDPTKEPGPEQNLAYYSGLAVIFQGKVIKLWDHDPQRRPPDPKQLLTELQQKFPRHQSLEDVDGLWGYKCEVTPLGQEKLPNCEQLSPLFCQNDHDEFGNEIGYSLLNLSAVGISFQNGTNINLSKSLPVGLGMPYGWTRYFTSAKAKHRALALSTTAFSRNKQMNDTMPPELMAKLMKHGLAAEPMPEEMAKALARYMSETEDGPTERKMMAESYAQCMAKMNESAPDGSQAEMGDNEAKKDSKDSMDEDMKMQGQMSKLQTAQHSAFSTLTKQNQEMMSRLQKLEQEKADAEKTVRAVSFARQAVEQGRWPAKDEKSLVELAKAGQGELAIVPFSAGTFTVKQKWTSGGGPKDQNEMASGSVEGGSASKLGKFLARGVTLSAMAKKLSEEKKISLGAAQLEISKKHPELYADKV